MKIIEFSEEKFNLDENPSLHIIQSSIWAKFRKTQGSESILFLSDTGQYWIMYITAIPHAHGYGNIGIITQSLSPTEELLNHVREIAKEKHLLFVKFEPLLENTPENVIYLQRLGLVKGIDYFLKSTFILYLKNEDIMSQFSSSTRRNIRIAQKKLVTIDICEYKEDDYTNIDIFLEMLSETTNRHKFALHNKAYFHEMYDTLQEHMLVLHARYNEEVVGSIVLFINGATCYYPYGASLHKYIDTKAINLLIYKAVLYAQSRNCTAFNFWGALEEPFSTDNPLAGVHNFKKGYGGTLYTYVGAYDLVMQKTGYLLFTAMYRLYWKIRKLTRKRT